MMQPYDMVTVVTTLMSSVFAAAVRERSRAGNGPAQVADQRRPLPNLPDRLSRMSLFVLNTDVRDDVGCHLRWQWEIKVPELGISVFEGPMQHAKGKKRSRVVVCNGVAQSVFESVRGQHEDFVLVYRRGRTKNMGEPPLMAYRGIEPMNNTAWQRARREAGLGDLHVHDLRHTMGMRLREWGAREGTIADLRWDSTATMTRDDSDAQIVELPAAVEKVKEDSGRWNKSLQTLRREQEALRVGATPPKVPQQRETA